MGRGGLVAVSPQELVNVTQRERVKGSPRADGATLAQLGNAVFGLLVVGRQRDHEIWDQVDALLGHLGHHHGVIGVVTAQIELHGIGVLASGEQKRYTLLGGLVHEVLGVALAEGLPVVHGHAGCHRERRRPVP